MRLPRTLLLGLPLVVLLGAILFLATTSLFRADPALDGIDSLLAEKQFDRAEKVIGDYLERHPESAQANMLMAQVALARSDQKPDLALKHLRRVRVPEAMGRAIVSLNEGKAFSALGRYRLAEQSWREALLIEPQVPEAGWALLGLYYIQGRRDDAHRLAMRLLSIEPDPRDRAQLLLELLRQDAKTVILETLVPTLEPIFRNDPEDLHTGIALSLALIRTSRPEEGLAILRRLVDLFSDRQEVWDTLLTGLDESFRYDEMSHALDRLPAAIAVDPRFEKHRGALAQSRRQWSEAADAYRRALAFDPSESRSLYRLCQVLRSVGRNSEAVPFEKTRRAQEQAREQLLTLYERANAVKTLGTEPHAELSHRLADIRELMGRDDEAMGWHRLVLMSRPDDPVSLAAVKRLVVERKRSDQVEN